MRNICYKMQLLNTTCNGNSWICRLKKLSNDNRYSCVDIHSVLRTTKSKQSQVNIEGSGGGGGGVLKGPPGKLYISADDSPPLPQAWLAITRCLLNGPAISWLQNMNILVTRAEISKHSDIQKMFPAHWSAHAEDTGWLWIGEGM
jgi:hypothetical protein